MRRAVPLCRGVLPGAFVLVCSLIAQAKHGWGQGRFGFPCQDCSGFIAVIVRDI